MIFFMFICFVAMTSAYFAATRIDLFTIAYAASLVYLIPALIPRYSISDEVYVYYLMLLSGLLVGAILSRRFVLRDSSPLQAVADIESAKRYLKMASFMTLLSLVAYGIQNPTSIFSSGRVGEQGAWFFYFLFVTLLGFSTLASLTLRVRVISAFCLFGFIGVVLHGDRTQIVIMGIALAIHASFTMRTTPFLLFRNIGAARVLLAVSICLVGLYGKHFYGAYADTEAGEDYSAALRERFVEDGIVPRSFEPYFVQQMLVFAVDAQDRVPGDYLLKVPLQILPWAGQLGGDAHVQSNLVKTLYFSNWSDSTGVSSNFLAEGYLVAGPAGVILMIIVYVVGLVGFTQVLRKRRHIAVDIGAAYMAAFWAFYLHRSSLLQIVSHEKRVIYCSLLVYVAVVVVHSFRTMHRAEQ